MADGKQSFIFYTDWKETFEALPPEKAGELIVHILRYVNDEDPHTDDVLINAVFAHIKTTLKKDLKKWETASHVSSVNGRVGNLKRWQKDLYKQYKKGEITLEEAESISLSRKTSPPDEWRSGSVGFIAVNDNVNDNDNNSVCIYSAFAHLKITHTEVEKLREKGYTQEQIDDVIDQIKNYAKNKKYKSLYTTTLNWLKKRYDNSEPDYQLNKKHLMEIAGGRDEHEQWIHNTYSYHGILSGQMGYLASRFNEYLTSKAEAPTKMADYKKYFSSWLGWDSTRRKFADKFNS